ncbi:hypothetical protein G9464_09245 [Halostella sp. JP-L12]|uniref:hypothetical protein n=1 Tax=Halostella TaxID=1843185 RepID=UPI0013CEA153|nr:MULTISPECIES: hypothetical protein [Halostella]NHN47780.1 hypothetical protein [Halostella sp. JP-L12]
MVDRTELQGGDGRTGRRNVLKGLAATGIGVGGLRALAGRSRAADDLPNELTIRGGDETVAYRFAVDGDVEKGPDADGDDEIEDGVVRGAVESGERDSYRFAGKVTEFVLRGSATVLVNGERIDLRDTNSVTIEAREDGVEYRIGVTDAVTKGPDADGDDEIDDESEVRGTVSEAGERDSYVYTGEFTEFEVEGRATVWVNGEPVGSLDDLGSDDDETRETERDDAEFALEQGDDCVPFAPLPGDDPVEAFYDYRAPFTDPAAGTYSSHGTTDLQEGDASVLFLYDGPEGLSLVVVHGRLDGDSDGGYVTFEMTGLPESGEWVVRDDDYDGQTSYDVWDRDGDEATVSWTWGAGRTDGGAFRGLADLDELTIDPAFNDAAELAGEYNEGEVETWVALSGDADDPDRTELALDERVTIRRGACDGSD